MGKMDARRNMDKGVGSSDRSLLVRAHRLPVGPAPFVRRASTLGASAASALLLACASLLGCNDPCVDHCDAAKVCPEADTSVDCEVACKDELEAAIEYDCDVQLQAKIDCEGKLTDVCNDQDTCLQETLDYADCRKRIDQP